MRLLYNYGKCMYFNIGLYYIGAISFRINLSQRYISKLQFFSSDNFFCIFSIKLLFFISKEIKKQNNDIEKNNLN
jgi:hypothetical protein